MDRESASSSPEGSFHYVDFRRNAVRGPDSHRDFSKGPEKELGRVSWTRSPTRASRDGKLPTINDTWTRSHTEAFQDLLPMELTRRSSQGRPERSSNSIPLKRVPGRMSDIPGSSWHQPSSNNKIPTTPVSSFASQDTSSSVQEEAWREQVEIWFKEADTKDNGRIEGDEAVAFFSRTGLPDEDLSKMWRYAVPSGEHCMSKTHFINALKLVSVLQNDGRLTPETVVRAISKKYPNPSPRISALPRANYENPHNLSPEDDDDDSSSSSSESMSKTRAFSMPAPTAGTDWSEARLRPGLITQDISLDVAYSAELSDPCLEDASGPSKTCLVSVQLRLAPLKSKQSANLRKVIGVNSSLIAAPSLNGGVLQYFRVQDHPEAINNGHFKKLDTEDADSAFCTEINPSHARSSGKVTCMLTHEHSGYLFLGYDDSYVEMHHIGKAPIMLTKCVNQWKAHKHGSVDAMAMTIWGDLWTGTSKGSIRVWSDLTAGKTPNGRVLRRTGGEKPHGGVTSIVVSSCASVVWTAGQNNIALWQAYSGEYLGRIETDKSKDSTQLSNSVEKTLRINTCQGLDLDVHGRITNALSFGIRTPISAEDVEGDTSGTGLKVAVGRFTKMIGKGTKRIGKLNNKGQPTIPNNIEDEAAPSFSPIQSLAAMLDNHMWVGYKNGLLERFTWNGRFKERRFFPCGLSCLRPIKDHLWIGLVDGTLVVYDLDFKELKQWSAHEATIIDLALLGPLVYSLAADGSIKGWSYGIPNQTMDSMAWQRFQARLKDMTDPHSFKVFCGTWNVNQARPPSSSLRSWLCGNRQHLEADIIVLGLQEVEGAGSVAKTMTYGKYAKSNSDKGSATANWWAEKFQETLDCSDPEISLASRWKRLALRQMSGIIIYVFARNKLMGFIGNVGTAHVGTGVMGVGSNKGGVAITFSLYRRRVTVVASHFAAHKQNVEKRNADYRTLNQLLTFSKEKDVIAATPGGSNSGLPATPPYTVTRPMQFSASSGSSSVQQVKNQYGEVIRVDSSRSLEMESTETQLSKGLRRAEMLIWVGDFNYRVDRTFSEALHLIKNGKALQLLKWDQCRHQMKSNKVFVGLREGKIEFNPTYKFAKNINDIHGYDSEKERVPSWTDRIFFRGSKSFVGIEDDDHEDPNPSLRTKASEDEPLIGLDDNQSTSFLDYESTENPSDHEVDEIVVTCEKYDGCMGVVDSDHKPVWCLLNVHFPAFIQERMRKVSFDILREEMSRLIYNVGLHLSTKFIDFIGDGQKMVEVRNMSDCKVRVVTLSEQSDNPNPHIPGWLDIMPHSAILDAGLSTHFRFTTSQKGIGAKQSSSRIYKKLVIRAEALNGSWHPVTRDYELGVLLRPT